jgi:phosphohistidine phosphatase SixA
LERIYYNEIIYGAPDIELIDLIKSIFKTTLSVMIVGYNPGLTDLANYLTKENIVNIPTSGVFFANIDIDNWKKINRHCGKIEFLNIQKYINKQGNKFNSFTIVCNFNNNERIMRTNLWIMPNL